MYAATAALLVAGGILLAQQSTTTPSHLPPELPLWAYPTDRLPAVQPSAAQAAGPASNAPQHVPGSRASYLQNDIPDLFVVPDWFPSQHPPMPPVVAHGRKPDVYACAHCHLPTGAGRPENQSVAGLPATYMKQQIEDFASGARHSSDPRLASVTAMIRVARNATPQEIEEGVAYFASLKPGKWIRVVETATVPTVQVGDLMLIPAAQGGTEPIGNRVIEMPENLRQTELRNPNSGFVAYVPPGSLRRGRQLVQSGPTPCATCHGAGLRGANQVPSIAGRSPSQMARQLIDFRTGARSGAGAALMKPIADRLTQADIVAVTGYLASLQP